MSTSIDHKARRFQQIAGLERQLSETYANIAMAKDHVKELKQEAEGIVQALRAAARDEGQLPLLDMMEEPEGQVS